LVKNLATLPLIGALSYFFYKRKVLDENSSINKPDIVSGATIKNYHFQNIKGNIVSERDFERLAPEYMSRSAWEFANGGAGDGITLRHNDEA
jgi:hypothetical protein